MSSPGWITEWGEGDYLVYPIDDKQEHDLESPDCPCSPTIEVMGDKLLIIHNAFDFRDVLEELEEINAQR